MLALKNLLRNPVRSGLTTLGVAMGIAMLVSVSDYGKGIGTQLQNAVSNRYQLILQSRGVSTPFASLVSQSDVSRVGSLDGIDEAQPVVFGSTRTDQIPFFLVIGLASRSALAGNVSLVNGRFNREDEAEIILGHNAARILQVETGDEISLQQYRFDVAGTFSSESNILNSAGIVGIADAQKLLNRPGQVNVILLKLDPGAGVKSVGSQLEHEFPHLQLTRSVDILGRLELFLVIEKVTTSLGLIAVLFSILIVMNTLLMSLSERRREIGILLAIGWSRTMIARTLLLESLIISLAGGVVGIATGALALRHFSQSNIPGINWSAPGLAMETLWTALVLSAVIALLSSLYPIYLSSRLSPAQILQQERG